MSGVILVVVPAVALLAVIAGGVVLVVTARRAAPLVRARAQAIAALCAQRGMVPDPAPADFAILGPIDRRWFTNAFSSSDHAVGKHTQFFSVLAFRVAGVNVPFVAVTRRDLLGVVLGGPPAVELESIDFDDHFMVKAKDRRSAVMLLDPGVMQLLLDCDDVNFDMVGDKVIAIVNRAAQPAHQPAEPVEFEVLFRFMDGFMARVPAILRSEYAAAP
ncbi:MAG: hypothetical protein E6J40_08810 [Chloroflexi bacterium]|nr:MAG: hypothetical protein E6J40_08810 [Chloroflexota bacterium]